MHKKVLFLTADQWVKFLDILRQREAEVIVVCRTYALLVVDNDRSGWLVSRTLCLDLCTVRDWPPKFLRTDPASLDLAAHPERQGMLARNQETKIRERLRNRHLPATGEVRDTIQRENCVQHARVDAIKRMLLPDFRQFTETVSTFFSETLLQMMGARKELMQSTSAVHFYQCFEVKFKRLPK